jgi:dTDP-4-dehydrorhamnose reductase
VIQKTVLIGANGQLSHDLLIALAHRPTEFEVLALTHADLEICDHQKTREILTNIKPHLIINTAAYHRVDECEEQLEKPFRVNAVAVQNLALICRDLDATLLHMSTDYVYGGDKTRHTPYKENDAPFPVNVYGVSKLAGEYCVRTTCPKHFVVRSSGLYGIAGSSGKGGNFVELMLRLAREKKQIRVVNDQCLTPTYTVDLARKLIELVLTKDYGLYHITSTGQCTWYEFAAEIFRLTGVSPDFEPTITETFGAKAHRPSYSVLEHSGIIRLGLKDTRPWQEALSDYLKEKRAM